MATTDVNIGKIAPIHRYDWNADYTANTGKQYIATDTVRYMGGTYAVAQTHTSAADKAPTQNADNAYWLVVVPNSNAVQPVGVASASLTINQNHTLTSASMRSSRLVSATNSFSIYLPDATTLTAVNGGVVWYFKNDTTLQHTIRNSAGTAILAIAPGDSKIVWCTDTSTAIGEWAISGSTTVVPGGNLVVGTEYTFAPSNIGESISACEIDADRAFVVWQQPSGGRNAIFGSICTLSTMDFTTPKVVLADSTWNYSTQNAVCKIAANKVFIAAKILNASNSYQNDAAVVIFSTNYFTVGTVDRDPNNYSTSVGSLIAISPAEDKAVIGFTFGDINSARGCLYIASSSSLTRGAVAQISNGGAGSNGKIDIEGLSTTQFLITGSNATPQTCVNKVSISGTTLTADANSLTFSAVGTQKLVKTLSQKNYIAYTNTNIVYIGLVDSTSTPTITNQTQITKTETAAYLQDFALLDSKNTAILSYKRDTAGNSIYKLYVRTIEFDGATWLVGDEIEADAANCNDGNFAVTMAGKALLCYTDVGQSGFGNARKIEMGA